MQINLIEAVNLTKKLTKITQESTSFDIEHFCHKLGESSIKFNVWINGNLYKSFNTYEDLIDMLKVSVAYYSKLRSS